jgi:N-methylhydantoinase B
MTEEAATRVDIDPTTLAVVMHALEQVATQMDTAFVTTAFSPIIAEGKDTASGIYASANGDVIAQGELGMPVFIAAMQYTVAEVIRSGRRHEEGDVFIVNDPYRGGTHLMDVKFVTPFYYQGEHLFFLANSGHWPDIGGSAPGGFAVQATEMYQEGLRFTGVRLVRKGEIDPDMLEVILSNVRVPQERVGDIRAQLASLDVGRRALTALLDRFSKETVLRCIPELRRRAELHVRSLISEIPNGTYSYEDFMDNDGVEDVPVRLAVDLTVRGDQMSFDFSKSSPPRKGPINAPLNATECAVHIALKHTYPDIPVNAGSFVPVQVIAPKATCLNATFPRPTNGCAAELLQRVIEVALGALGQAVPDDVGAASAATVMNTAIGGYDEEIGPYVLYAFNGGGYGGYLGGDGLTYGASTVGTSKTYPMEVFELRHPFRIRQFALHEGSAGPGRWRGGFGAIMEMELLRGEAVVSIMGDRTKFPAGGARGGGSGACSKVEIIRGGGLLETLPMGAKVERLQLVAGDRIRLSTPGGGGYGSPLERDTDAIADDLRRGYFRPETVETQYGVRVTASDNVFTVTRPGLGEDT